MHAWYKKHGMTCHAQECLINHALLPKYAQKFWRQEKKVAHFQPNLIFSFFLIFTFRSSHTIPIILYSNKHFFVKKTSTFFLPFSTWYIFLSTPFYSNMSFFIPKYIYFEQMNKTLIFQFFLFENKTSSYPEKGIEW